MTRRLRLVPVAMMVVATVAFPCGGSNAFTVDGPLVSASRLAEQAIAPVFDFDSYTRAEVRFLPALLATDSARFAGLLGRPPLQEYWWDTLTAPRVKEPDARAINAAWSTGDVTAAAAAARTAVARIVALPASSDEGRDSVLRLAVETIELGPAVQPQPAASRRAAFEKLAAPYRVPLDSVPGVLARAGTSPRRASLEYAMLRLAVQRGIPDETREEIAKQVPAARWDSLHAAHRAWLARNADHPYAPWVRFGRLRLFFLASQADSAWDTAIALYRDHPVRAASEMRYMLRTMLLPPERLLLDARVPVEIRTALVGNLTPRGAAWGTLMRLAADSARAPWATALEMRLLAARAVDSTARGALPREFPAWRATAPPFWRYMWALNQVRAGRADDALPFTATPIAAGRDSSLAHDAVNLATRIHVLRGDWAAAVQVPGLDQWTRRYLLRALAPDSVALRLAAARDAAVAREARLVVAARAAQQGAWDAAADAVRPGDAARAARYARLGALSRDTASSAGLLRFARAAAAQHGVLFYESTRYGYRGLMYRAYDLHPPAGDEGLAADAWELPWTKDWEMTRMYRHLREGSERLLALRLYRSYFGRADVTPVQRRAAAREADKVYRALVDTDPSRSDSGFWGDSLPRSPEAQAIRQAARR